VDGDGDDLANPMVATATTGATAKDDWSDGGTRRHGARALRTTRGEGEGGDG
jgi:hypothetical protein